MERNWARKKKLTLVWIVKSATVNSTFSEHCWDGIVLPMHRVRNVTHPISPVSPCASEQWPNIITSSEESREYNYLIPWSSEQTQMVESVMSNPLCPTKTQTTPSLETMRFYSGIWASEMDMFDASCNFVWTWKLQANHSQGDEESGPLQPKPQNMWSSYYT